MMIGNNQEEIKTMTEKKKQDQIFFRVQLGNPQWLLT
jgi:hypothetical protein